MKSDLPGSPEPERPASGEPVRTGMSATMVRWRTPLLVLAALIALYLLLQTRSARYTTSAEAVFDIEPDSVARFEVKSGTAQVELARRDSLWVVAEHEENKVRDWRITNFFDRVLAVERESMISANPDKWATYGVSDSAARQVLLYDARDELLGHIYVGRSRANFSNNYVRLAGDERVYLTASSIYHNLDTDSTFWLEPKPVEADTVEEEQN